MISDKELLVPYWLRTVRIGIVTTALVVGCLCVPPILSSAAQYRSVAYFAVLAAAALGGGLVAVLPWRKLFADDRGIYFMYAWSAADIVLITLAIAVTGGGRSEFVVTYALTTVFFGASYPPRGQQALLAFTIACYLAVLAATGWDITAAALFVRLAMLALLAIMARFLSGELMRQMAAHSVAAATASRWAGLLSAVATASRKMTLDRDRVIDVVLDAILDLGFDGASLCALDEDGQTYRVVQSRGLPSGYGGVYPTSAGVTGLVLSRGRTVVVDDYSARPEAIPLLADAGFRAVVATPVWVEGWLAAVVVGGATERRQPLPQEVEALELLAGQVGLALENVKRYEEELEAVNRLEELDRMKSDFLASVSHEIRTPVTVIGGVGTTLQKMWHDLDDATREHMLNGLTSNARTLEELITTLLDFSRVESGRVDVRFDVVDLSQSLRSVVTLLGDTLRGHPLSVEVEDGLEVHADQVLIDRCVQHLLLNAAKHTPPSTPVKVSARRADGEVEVTVSDQGPGIPPDELEHLGERFFRGGELNSRRRGLGLGLALVREMLDLHGTSLDVRSEPGSGASFSFRLRAASHLDGSNQEGDRVSADRRPVSTAPS